MANVQRFVAGDADVVKVPIAANIKVEVGDFIFKNVNQKAIPASGVTQGASVNATITTNRRNFIGVSFSQHLATEGAGNILVGTNGFLRMDSSGVLAATGVGTFLTIASGVGALANQKVVIGTDPSGCIATLAEDLAVATTDGQRIKIKLVGNIQPALV